MTTIEESLEGSTPLAEKVRRMGPFESSRDLIEAMRAVAPTLSEEEKIATLNAHPRIGAPAGKLSARSLREQGSDSLPELNALNDAYEGRFGFRFVIFVNGRSKPQIAEVLRQRMQRSRGEEMNAGLEAIIDIAQDRLRR